MVGAGVYNTSGFTLNDLGSPGYVVLAWIVAGVIAICGAISYGALASRFTESGGEYLFLTRAIHPAAGYVAGFVSIIAGFTSAIAFAARTLEIYLSSIHAFEHLPSGTIAFDFDHSWCRAAWDVRTLWHSFPRRLDSLRKP